MLNKEWHAHNLKFIDSRLKCSNIFLIHNLELETDSVACFLLHKTVWGLSKVKLFIKYFRTLANHALNKKDMYA